MAVDSNDGLMYYSTYVDHVSFVARNMVIIPADLGAPVLLFSFFNPDGRKFTQVGLSPTGHSVSTCQSKASHPSVV